MRPHLEPVKLKKFGESTNSGPFIFTPLNLGKERNAKEDGKMGKHPESLFLFINNIEK